MRDETARELRTLRSEIQRANRRIATGRLVGKVKAGSQDLEKRTVQLIIGETPDGKEILSPPVRWKQQGAGRLKIHSVPADNEQMELTSPSGTIGQGSTAQFSTYDDDNAAPSSKDSEAVIEFSDGSRITIEKDQTTFAASKINLGGAGGEKVARVGDFVEIALGSSAGRWPIVTGSDVVSAT